MGEGSFQAPSAEQVRRHLLMCPPRPPGGWAMWLPMAALGMVAALSLTVEHALMSVLPWMLLGGVIGAASWRAGNIRRLEDRVNYVHELAMLRHWPAALRLTWVLLPRVCASPPMHGRTVALLAHLLDQVKAYDAAIVAYDYLIDHLPSEHPGSIQLRLHRAMAQLSLDQLIDADDAIRRCRGVMDRFAGTAMSATYRLASLFQMVRTNHFADAIEAGANLAEDLRPLGVDAGYGHALMALSCHRLATAGRDDLAELAKQWWATATLLLPAETLLWRFAELKPVMESLPASNRPTT
ncbi:MAG: hypothetical protein IT440_00790 [Phycisphaeraceae bacterium]|nr:hypothetical protein [Phycisphaeraceae bacterium]